MTPEYVFAVASKIPPSASQLEKQAKHWSDYTLKSALTGWCGREATIEDFNFYLDYAEPGYSTPKRGIITGDWNNISQRVADILERMGYELEYDDEWTSCDECNKLVRTSPDGHGWKRSYWMPDDCSIICQECTNPEEYLESLHDKTSDAATLNDIDPAKHGYTQLQGDFENGFHKGMNDNPKAIYRRLRESGEERPLIFVLDHVSQFYITFSVWAKLMTNDDAIELLDRVLVYLDHIESNDALAEACDIVVNAQERIYRKERITNMAFMKKQITCKQCWLKVETDNGTEYIAAFDTGLDLPSSSALPDGVTEENSADVQAYCTGKVQSWENIEGHGARLSAPGYLDCTEWTVFDTPEEAEEYLEEYYGDDEEEEEVS